MTDFCFHIIRNAFSREIPYSKTHDFALNGYNKDSKEEILQWCANKKYTPVVANYFIHQGIDVDFWQQKYDFYLQRNRILIRFLGELFSAFKKAGVTSLFVYENFGALLASGTDIALYSSGDIDICGDIAERNQIIAVMESFEFFIREAHTKFVKEIRIGFAGKIGNMDYRLNIMFMPLVRYKLPITIDYHRVLEHAPMRNYQNTDIIYPSANALMYLCFLRISIHGYVRSPDMRLYIDIYNCLQCKIDWNIILDWARKDNTLVRVVTVAIISHELFGTSIPEEVLGMVNDRNLKVSKLLPVVCDLINKRLHIDLGRINSYKMEFYSDNLSVPAGFLRILFPPKKWMMSLYGFEDEPLLKVYLRYLKYIL